MLWGGSVLAIGIGIVSAAAWLVGRRYLHRRNAVAAEGTVIGLRPHPYDGSITYHPEVKFRLPSGEEKVICSESGSNPASYKVGQVVRVRYLADRPEEAWLDSFMENWGGAAAIASVGVFLVFWGASVLSK